MSKRFVEDKYLKEQQYNNAQNLSARIRLHQEYSTNQQDIWQWFFDWVLEETPKSAQVLECGTGRGDLWRINADRIPETWRLTLTDFSAGMIEDNKAHIGDLAQRVTYRVADVQELPFEDNTFDIAFANYMLYHAPDIPKAIAELRRVLKPDGVLFAATNGKNHMVELFLLASNIDPSSNWEQHFELTFSTQNGANFLEDQFSDVQFRPFESDLFVTEAQPIMDYIASMIRFDGQEVMKQRGEEIRAQLEEEITTNGGFKIRKETGYFVARGTR